MRLCAKCDTYHDHSCLGVKTEVDTPELRRLVSEYRHACDMVQGHAVPQWRALVTHITNLIKKD